MDYGNPKDTLSKHYTGVWNAAPLEKVTAAIEDTLAADYVDYNPTPGTPSGLEGFKQFVAMLHTAYPDLCTEVDVLLAEDNLVTARWTMRGTQTGPLAIVNLPPTGTPIQITGIDIVRVAGGKIVEWWHQEDILSMLVQLGFVPVPGQVPAS